MLRVPADSRPSRDERPGPGGPQAVGSGPAPRRPGEVIGVAGERGDGVAVLAENEAVDARGIDLQPLAEQGTEAEGVEDGAQADGARRGPAQLGGGEVGEHVDGVGDDQENGVGVRSRGDEIADDGAEEGGVALDQLEAGLVGTPAQAGGDDDDVGAGDVFVASGLDGRGADGGAAVGEVEGLALGGFGGYVHEDYFGAGLAQLEGVGGVGTDAAGSADDGDFSAHCSASSSLSSSCKAYTEWLCMDSRLSQLIWNQVTLGSARRTPTTSRTTSSTNLGLA